MYNWVKLEDKNLSARSSIAKQLATKLQLINGSSPYSTKLYKNNIYTKLIFWDEINDFPAICIVPGTETREYHPGGFKWGFINIALKLYVHGEDSLEKLEELIQDVELIITNNEELVYDSGKTTTEILITSITTDEGLLTPYGVGEINISVRYEI